MNEEKAIAIGFLVSVLAGITVAIIIAFVKREFPSVAADL